MKEAIASVGAVQFLPEEKLTTVKVIYLKGDKYLCGLKTREDDLIEYKETTKFHSLDELANFIGEAICITEDRQVWRLPQVRLYSIRSLHSGNLETYSFKTDEEAEEKFNELVEKYNLTVK
jgi:hypothetical protein